MRARSCRILPLLWSRTIHGSVAWADDESLITTPLLGDGNWRGGWWARYDRNTGAVIWRRWHRRGASLFALVGEMIIATTHKGSGVYAINYATGRKLWSRLGDRFDLLLKLCEFLPCDNEGDGPMDIVNDLVFTGRGRMLDPATGKIESRHRIDYHWDSDNSCTTLVDGKPWMRSSLWPVYSAGNEIPTGEIERLLAGHGLVASLGHAICIRQQGAYVYVIACAPPEQYRNGPWARLNPLGPPGKPNETIRPFNVPHFLLVLRVSDNAIVHREELGNYYLSRIAWLDRKILAIDLQTTRQWNWSYRRDVRVYDLTGLPAGIQ